ncbi:transporter substrate-binding domain-containing protein [Solihabitans fulvus]|uniref:Transporter substrate-binding domain-containing protein n=1 Tax=Solihabitans fulvus TaxID=1892852 RepID=A0A5B2WCI1_9PSEU|nr:ABC transporter substrate-binding protein [Solihabitans fulvus]KAA2248864.1 transporter substrate-binding domain-containing protein [Solihabitans fulvus]
MARTVGRTASRPIHMIVGTLAAILTLAATSGCGLLGSKSAADNNSSGRVEKSTIKIGVIPVIDDAPVFIAQKRGYFKQEGLDVELKTIQGGAAGITGLISGDLDFTFGNWVSFFAAEAKGAAKAVDGIKLVADGYQGKNDMFLVMASADSPVKGPKDLAGKTIGVNTFKNIAELAVRATLQANGVDPASVTFKEFPFPDMTAALTNKQVDAAFMVEPFITQAERTAGAIPAVDTMSGPIADLPIAGYGTSGKVASADPKTVAAFQRALARGQQDAAQRSVVEELLPEYAKIDKETAGLVHFGVYPTSLDATRLTRVTTLMRSYGMLDRQVDVQPMLVAGSGG